MSTKMAGALIGNGDMIKGNTLKIFENQQILWKLSCNAINWSFYLSQAQCPYRHFLHFPPHLSILLIIPLPEIKTSLRNLMKHLDFRMCFSARQKYLKRQRQCCTFTPDGSIIQRAILLLSFVPRWAWHSPIPEWTILNCNHICCIFFSRFVYRL